MKASHLDRWFDTTKPIEDVLVDLTEAQLVIEALKNDIDPGGATAHRQYREMRKAVRQHNRKF